MYVDYGKGKLMEQQKCAYYGKGKLMDQQIWGENGLKESKNSWQKEYKKTSSQQEC